MRVMEYKDKDGQYIPKAPAAVLDYPFRWGPWLAEIEDTIASAEVTASDGITIENVQFTDTTVTVWLSGGELLRVYKVTCSITTAGGRVDTRTMRIKVVPR